MPTLKKSDNSTLSSTMTVAENRRIVQKGHGTVTTAGTTGYDTVTLIAAQDAAYAAASSGSPILLGVDDIQFKPQRYPAS